MRKVRPSPCHNNRLPVTCASDIINARNIVNVKPEPLLLTTESSYFIELNLSNSLPIDLHYQYKLHIL